MSRCTTCNQHLGDTLLAPDDIILYDIPFDRKSAEWMITNRTVIRFRTLANAIAHLNSLKYEYLSYHPAVQDPRSI